MTQQTSPFVEGKWGWELGESGWNLGMDENLLKFSYLFDKNITEVVSSLPAAVNGQAYFLTTDNRVYFAVGGIFYSTPIPKWFTLTIKATGQTFQFDGTTLNEVPNSVDVTDIQATIASLGTAAFQPSSAFAAASSLASYALLNSPTFTGTVNGITKAMVGLGSVDNTSDLLKPISTATQAALDSKVAPVETILKQSANPTVDDRTSDILSAVASMRGASAVISDDTTGTNITAYSSGTLVLGRGVFRITMNQLIFTQDLGLKIKGQGSRRSNNSVKAPTTILVTGSGSGVGIRAQGPGGRGLTLEDLDLCYETSAYTGSLLDSFNSPGTTAVRCFIGTYGTTGGTRLQTARACIRSTYDEFMTFICCSFDGAVDGWWSDDTRNNVGSSAFGGSNTSFIGCVWYDFTGKMINIPGNRARFGLKVMSSTFNPISVNCLQAVDARNVEGLSLDTIHCAGSVANHATAGWLYLDNCKGDIVNSQLDDNSDAGTINGQIDISNNRIFCLAGFNITGGIITGSGNTYSKATTAVTVSPIINVTLDIGPDFFKAAVGTSYSIPSSALIDGRVNYILSQDASTNKFSNAAANVSITNIGISTISVTGNRSLLARETGIRFVASGAVGQTIGLPTATAGISFIITKTVSQDLTVTGSFLTGTGGVKTVAFSAAANVGGTLVVTALGSSWQVTSLIGTWAFS